MIKPLVCKCGHIKRMHSKADDPGRCTQIQCKSRDKSHNGHCWCECKKFVPRDYIPLDKIPAVKCRLDSERGCPLGILQPHYIEECKTLISKEFKECRLEEHAPVTWCCYRHAALWFMIVGPTRCRDMVKDLRMESAR